MLPMASVTVVKSSANDNEIRVEVFWHAGQSGAVHGTKRRISSWAILGFYQVLHFLQYTVLEIVKFIV